MLAAAASLLNIQVVILDEGHAPAKQIVYPSDSRLNHIDGSFKEPKKILELAKQVDVLTVEIEHVDVDALQAAQRDKGVVIHPSPSSIRIIQDKYQQKVHLSANGISVADFLQVASTEEDIRRATDSLGLPLMLKSRTFAYDGRGNFLLSNLQEIPDAIRTLGNRPLYAERCIQFEREVAVMVVRSASGEMLAYPPAETIHKENICHLVFAPCRSRDPTLLARAEALAVDVVRTFEGAGVFGVEMFLMGDGEENLLKSASSTEASYFRIFARERGCTATAQLGTLHDRSLRDIPI
jgi:phosphoribosylaminoimidazole carboxylase